jgi:ubiquinone/menaquinone biosynthesis C-methylase UbiE
MKDIIYGDFSRYYDFLGWNKFSQICAERLRHFVKLRGSGSESVLDLACGTGELEYQLKKTKLIFTGVDISRQMLSEARRKNRGIEFIHGDMTNIRLSRQFDIVVCFFDSVNHLSGITNIKKMFKTARIHLSNGGFFIFDMLSPEGLERWESVEIRRDNDYYVTVNGFYDPEKIKAGVTIEGFIKMGKKGYSRFCQQVKECSYPLDKIAEALTIAGFSDISVTSFDIEEPIEHTSRWYFVVS